MVSDFVEEQFLWDSSDEACLMIKTSREDYFRNKTTRGGRKLSTLLSGYILKHKDCFCFTMRLLIEKCHMMI